MIRDTNEPPAGTPACEAGSSEPPMLEGELARYPLGGNGTWVALLTAIDGGVEQRSWRPWINTGGGCWRVDVVYGVHGPTPVTALAAALIAARAEAERLRGRGRENG